MELNPHQQAEKMMLLSEEQSRLGEEATTLEIAEALYLNEFRAAHASDKAVQSAWKVTEQGQEADTGREQAQRHQKRTLGD